ncbi:MAG: hypothetical protein ABIK96_02205 [bacterium]
MSQDKSDVLWSAWSEAASKFDYFMAGLIAAITAYVGKGISPGRLGFNPHSLEIVGSPGMNVGDFARTLTA